MSLNDWANFWWVIVVSCLVSGAIAALIGQKKNLGTGGSFALGFLLGIIGIVIVILQKPGLPPAPPGMRAVKCTRCNAVQNIPGTDTEYTCWQCQATNRLQLPARTTRVPARTTRASASATASHASRTVQSTPKGPLKSPRASRSVDKQPVAPGRWRRNVWVMVGIALVAMTLVGGFWFIGLRLGNYPTTPPEAVPVPGTGPAPSLPGAGTPPQAALSGEALATDFVALEMQLHAVAGIVVSAVGNGQPQITLGDWQTGPAWGTVEVPLAIAGLRAEPDNPPEITEAMKAAITKSDNTAAESVWASLGDPVTAAHKVEDVLRQTGDPTIVQSQKVRSELTAFGQTIWPLTEQVRFLSVAVCDSANDPVFSLMGQVEPDQRWGIGTLEGTRFKGGWGPPPTGRYLVRQMGVLSGPNGMIAVALAAEPDSGKFDDGTAALTEMANWLSDHLGALPAGHCGP